MYSNNNTKSNDFKLVIEGDSILICPDSGEKKEHNSMIIYKILYLIYTTQEQ